MTNMNLILAVRQLYNQRLSAILATNLINMFGYPFGSVVQYCPDHDGSL